MGVYKQDGSKNWYIDFYDENGKRVRECTKTTNKALANKILAKRLEDVRLRKFGMENPDRLLFKELVKKYFNYAESEIKATTFDRYKVSSTQLMEEFSGKYIDRITVLDIEEYKQKRLKKVKTATVNRDMALLRRMFNQAKKWDLLAKSPMDKVDFLREDNIRTRYLEKEELDRLLNECRHIPHLYLAVKIAVHTGMRKQEILSLKIPRLGESHDKINWVDVENRYFHLNITKTGKHRKVPMNEQLVPLVVNAVTESYTGKLFKVKDIRAGFENARDRAHIENFTFHG